MTWDWLVQRTGKYCSIRRMEYPEFQTGIFGRMESALGIWKERPKSTWPTHVLTSLSQIITRLSYGTSLLAVTIVNNYAVTHRCKS